jgi:hypothetical protein
VLHSATTAAAAAAALLLHLHLIKLTDTMLLLLAAHTMHYYSIYFCYLFGGNFGETQVSEEFGLSYPPEGGNKGMRMRIGAAVSQDGINWSRIEVCVRMRLHLQKCALVLCCTSFSAYCTYCLLAITAKMQ